MLITRATTTALVLSIVTIKNVYVMNTESSLSSQSASASATSATSYSGVKSTQLRDRLLDEALDNVCSAAGILMQSHREHHHLDALRILLDYCTHARQNRNVGALLKVLAGMRSVLNGLAESSDMKVYVSQVVKRLERFETPDICTWRLLLVTLTNKIHEFIDALAIAQSLLNSRMKKLLVALNKKSTDLLDVEPLNLLALETFVNDFLEASEALQAHIPDEWIDEVKATMEELLNALHAIPLEHTVDMTCACGEC